MRGLEVLDDKAQPDASTAADRRANARARNHPVRRRRRANVLSFTPPFVITEKEIDFALSQLSQLIRQELHEEHEEDFPNLISLI